MVFFFSIKINEGTYGMKLQMQERYNKLSLNFSSVAKLLFNFFYVRLLIVGEFFFTNKHLLRKYIFHLVCSFYKRPILYKVFMILIFLCFFINFACVFKRLRYQWTFSFLCYLEFIPLYIPNPSRLGSGDESDTEM